MDYRDALEACLESISNGESRERAIARYPEHAAELREDVALSEAVRAYSTLMATPRDDAAARARLRLNNELVTLRNQRAVNAASSPIRASKPSFWRLPLFQGLALGVVALIAIAVFAFGGVITSPTTASAETLDGVVVETNPDGIVLQTDKGLQTVALDSTSDIKDESGTAVQANALQAGQVIQLKAKRVTANKLRAIAIQKRPLGSLAEWCRQHPVRCQEVAPKLPAVALVCEAKAGPCLQPTQVPSNATNGSSSTPSSQQQGRLRDLVDKCQKNGGQPCEDLRTFCRTYPGLCAVLTGWVRTMLDLPDNLQQRIQIESQRCENGSQLDCRELRIICQRNNKDCPTVAPNKSGDKATPRRPF